MLRLSENPGESSCSQFDETTSSGTLGIYIALIINDMEQSNKNITTSDPGAQGSAHAVFCKIFSDWVSPHLCDIRRKELIAQDTFSCDGCPSAPGGTTSARS